MDIREFLDQYGTPVLQGRTYNQYSTNPTKYYFNDTDIEKFNTIYRYLKASDLNTIIRTKSGGIAKGLPAKSNTYAWDCINCSTGCRITVIIDGYVYVFRVGSIKKGESEIAPWKAWQILCEQLRKDGVDIHDYAIENGKEIKGKIPSPYIQMNTRHEVLENVHHIDFHNSYPAGLCNTHPEFKPTIDRLYKLRKKYPINKAILNYGVGCMQSMKHPWHGKWAHLAKDAIEDNNRRIVLLTALLRTSGHRIIGFNTDGIWYQGSIYHGTLEGDDIGMWHNDHINCTFRAKSDGVYEFMENGVYNVVMRGTCKLDTVLDRSEWTWGDIYDEQAKVCEWEFDEELGIIHKE